MRSARCGVGTRDRGSCFFMARENRPNPRPCQSWRVHFPRKKFQELTKENVRVGSFIGSCRLRGKARSYNRLEEGHHRAQFRAQLFNLVGLLVLARGEEVWAA